MTAIGGFLWAEHLVLSVSPDRDVPLNALELVAVAAMHRVSTEGATVDSIGAEADAVQAPGAETA